MRNTVWLSGGSSRETAKSALPNGEMKLNVDKYSHTKICRTFVTDSDAPIHDKTNCGHQNTENGKENPILSQFGKGFSP